MLVELEDGTTTISKNREKFPPGVWVFFDDPKEVQKALDAAEGP